MRVEIICVTFGRDLDFCRAMLNSIEKFAKGFAAVHLVVPEHERPLFEAAVPVWVTLHSYPEESGNGMIQHEAEILMSDIWCPQADAILHMDADCIFTQPVSPYAYIYDGKPILYRERFENFYLTHPIRYGWKETVQKAIGIDPEWETMVRHPAIHIPKVYQTTRRIIEAVNQKPFYDYVMSCRNEFPQDFAEFPTLGAVAIEFFPELYNFIDYNAAGKDYPYRVANDRMISFWSHGGLDHVCDRDMEYPGGNALGKTPRQVFQELGL